MKILNSSVVLESTEISENWWEWTSLLGSWSIILQSYMVTIFPFYVNSLASKHISWAILSLIKEGRKEGSLNLKLEEDLPLCSHAKATPSSVDNSRSALILGPSAGICGFCWHHPGQPQPEAVVIEVTVGGSEEWCW